MGRLIPLESRQNAPSETYELCAMKTHDVILWCVVPQRVEELAADHVRRRSQFRVVRRVQFQQVTVVLLVLNHESRCHSIALSADHSPSSGRTRRCAVSWPALQILDGHSFKEMPFGVPRTIRNITERVRVERAAPGCSAPLFLSNAVPQASCIESRKSHRPAAL